MLCYWCPTPRLRQVLTLSLSLHHLMIYAENEENFQQNAERCERKLTKHKVLVNSSKTKTMVIGKGTK